ncbi:MAG: type II toxin-antitoxin system Phd/YefM family antitoxin [Candidatus Korobacteraceae bacterium]
MEVNIHEAKTHLSKLLERVALGEEVIIAKAGKPVARLVALKDRKRKRPLGLAKGEFTVPDDFDAPLPPEIEEDFYR